MTKTATTTTAKSPSNRRDLIKKGLNALLKDDEAMETTNESLPLQTQSIPDEKPMTIDNIIESEKHQKTKTKELSNDVRVTLLMADEIHKKIKIMAHWELTTLRDIINSSLEKTIVQYEKTHGQLVKVPKSQKTK